MVQREINMTLLQKIRQILEAILYFFRLVFASLLLLLFAFGATIEFIGEKLGGGSFIFC